tara:strand:- start:393 stop:536 length:144 start_codon:yes stop_codon:yes gene_type:complete
MNESKKGAGDASAQQERYESGKGCLSLLLVVGVFLMVSVAAAILTNL